MRKCSIFSYRITVVTDSVKLMIFKRIECRDAALFAVKFQLRRLWRLFERNGLDEAVLDTIAGELRVGLQLHFFHDPSTEAAYRTGTDGKPFPDADQGLAGGQHFQDVELAVREQLVRGLFFIEGDIVGQLFGDGRGNVFASL